MFLRPKCLCLALGTTQLQHGFGLISFTLAGEKACWFCTSLLYQNELDQHSTARLGMMLTCFWPCLNATINCTEPYWYHADLASSGSVNGV